MPDAPSPAPRFGNPKHGDAPPQQTGATPNELSGNDPLLKSGAGRADADGTVSGEPDGEVEVLITPRPAVLDELQVTEDEFEWALGRSLDLLEEAPDDEETPALEDVEIVLNGRTFRLEEVAEVEIGGDLTELGPLPELGDEAGVLGEA